MVGVLLFPGYQLRPPPCRGKACTRHAPARVTQASAATYSTQASQGFGGTPVQQRHPVACALAGASAPSSPRQASQLAALAERQPCQALFPRDTCAARTRQAPSRCRFSGLWTHSSFRLCFARGQRSAEAGRN